MRGWEDERKQKGDGLLWHIEHLLDSTLSILGAVGITNYSWRQQCRGFQVY